MEFGILGVPGHGTWCRVGATGYRVTGWADDGVRTEEGTVPLGELTDLFVDHHQPPPRPRRSFPHSAGYGVEDREPDWTGANQVLADGLRAALPADAYGVGLMCVALGTRISVSAQVIVDGRPPSWWLPQEADLEPLRRHRTMTYTPARGAWTQLICKIGASGDVEVTPSYDEPEWPNLVEDHRAHYEELRYLPRVEAPSWLLHGATQYHARHAEDPEPPRGPIRMVRVFDDRDEHQRPRVFRPELTKLETQRVLRYLNDGHVVLSAMSTSEDELDPKRPAEVPKAYCTDGTWVWPMATDYYLFMHGVAPPRDFLDHIRCHDYRAPKVVAAQALDAAKALVLDTDVESLGDPASTALDVIRWRIAELHVSRRFYSFEAPVEGGWTMLLGEDGWWTVFYTSGGEPQNEARFPDPYEAGSYLVGSLAMTGDPVRRQPDEPLADFECPLWPWPPDRGLAGYDNRLLADLPSGSEVDRFGGEDGNTVFVAGTTLPQRSMPPQQPPGPYRRYRVVTGFQVVSGIVRPDHGQVGGGKAYFLPRSVADLVSGGWLTAL